MKFCTLSDLHGQLIDIEPCDTLLICGDISPLQIQRNRPLMEQWLHEEFEAWVEKQPCSNVILIAGNHDFVFQQRNDWDYFFDSFKIHYLNNEKYSLMDSDGSEITFYGTPYCQVFGNWSFMLEDRTLNMVYDMIPNDIDILLLHQPPSLNRCGVVPPNRYSEVPVDAGNLYLARIIEQRKPKYTFCGHIHEGNHELKDLGFTKIANVSILDDRYEINYKPLYFEYGKGNI